MIKIYDKFGKIISEIDNSKTSKGEGIIDSLGRDVIAYIKVDLNNAKSLKFHFEVYESTAKDWFPIQFDNGVSLETYIREIKENGNYRIPVPTSKNEEKIKIVVEDIGDTDVNDQFLEAEIYLIPNYTQF